MRSGVRAQSGVMAAVVAAMVMLSGCEHATQGNLTADYPRAKQFPQIYQAKMMDAAHWQLIAANEASELEERFGELPELSYVATDQFSVPAFEHAYQNFLLGELTSRGALVFDNDRGMRVDVDVQVVKFDRRRQHDFPVGFFSAAGASAYIIGHALDAWANPSILLIPLFVGADAYNFFNADTNTPDTEIVLTTRVKNAGQLVYTHSSVYYLRAEDQHLYGPRRTIGVRGPMTL